MEQAPQDSENQNQHIENAKEEEHQLQKEKNCLNLFLRSQTCSQAQANAGILRKEGQNNQNLNMIEGAELNSSLRQQNIPQPNLSQGEELELQDVRRVSSQHIKFTSVQDYMAHLMGLSQSQNKNLLDSSSPQLSNQAQQKSLKQSTSNYNNPDFENSNPSQNGQDQNLPFAQSESEPIQEQSQNQDQENKEVQKIQDMQIQQEEEKNALQSDEIGPESNKRSQTYAKLIQLKEKKKEKVDSNKELVGLIFSPISNEHIMREDSVSYNGMDSSYHNNQLSANNVLYTESPMDPEKIKQNNLLDSLNQAREKLEPKQLNHQRYKQNLNSDYSKQHRQGNDSLFKRAQREVSGASKDEEEKIEVISQINFDSVKNAAFNMSNNLPHSQELDIGLLNQNKLAQTPHKAINITIQPLRSSEPAGQEEQKEVIENIAFEDAEESKSVRQEERNQSENNSVQHLNEENGEDNGHNFQDHPSVLDHRMFTLVEGQQNPQLTKEQEQKVLRIFNRQDDSSERKAISSIQNEQAQQQEQVQLPSEQDAISANISQLIVPAQVHQHSAPLISNEQYISNNQLGMAPSEIEKQLSEHKIQISSIQDIVPIGNIVEEEAKVVLFDEFYRFDEESKSLNAIQHPNEEVKAMKEFQQNSPSQIAKSKRKSMADLIYEQNQLQNQRLNKNLSNGLCHIYEEEKKEDRKSEESLERKNQRIIFERSSFEDESRKEQIEEQVQPVEQLDLLNQSIAANAKKAIHIKGRSEEEKEEEKKDDKELQMVEAPPPEIPLDVRGCINQWVNEQLAMGGIISQPQNVPGQQNDSQIAQFRFNIENNVDQVRDFRIDSTDTSPRSIPEEHDLDESFDNQYLDQYLCLMKGITWGRESHGLFDYGTRHPLKKQMQTDVESTLVRTSNNDLFLVKAEEEAKNEQIKLAQPLLNVKKQKNKYYLEALKVPKKDDLIPHIQSEVPNPANPNALLNGANAAGGAGGDESAISEMRERMYLIVRSMQRGDQKIPYKIKRHDIIKLGRVLFKVVELRIDEIEKQKVFKQWKETRRKLHQKKADKESEKKKEQAKNDNKLEKQMSESFYLEDEEVQELLFANLDMQAETCRECLEGEQNYQEIECEMPEPSIRIKLRKERDTRIKKRVEEQRPKQLANITSQNAYPPFRHHSLCKEGKSQSELNKVGGQERLKCVTQQQSFENIDPVSYKQNDQPMGMVALSQRQRKVESCNCQQQKQIKRPKSSGRQIIAREDGEVQVYKSGSHGSNQIHPEGSYNLKLSQKLQEDEKEEESLINDQKDNELAITKMDPNEVIGNEEAALNSEAGLDRDSPFCRFCWGNDISIANPLLSSCKCNGGIRFIHYNCLKEWLNTKRSVKAQTNIVSYFYKSFECELCKTPYPLVFKTKGRRYNLIDSAKSTGDYIMIESLTLEQNLARIVHVLQPTALANSVNMGRGHDSDLRVNDISVSRFHAVIKLKKDGFYLKDNKSKFGTLVLVKHRLSLSPQMTKAVQVGRTVINFCVKKLQPQNIKSDFLVKANDLLRAKAGGVIGLNFEEEKKEGDGIEDGKGGMANLDSQKVRLMKHLENMQQAEDYIAKQAAEHQRLANGENFHQRRFMAQQNIHEEEIKIDLEFGLPHPLIQARNLVNEQSQNRLPSSRGIVGRGVNQQFAPGQENVQQDEDERQQRDAVQPIGSVVRDSDMFNILRRGAPNDHLQPGQHHGSLQIRSRDLIDRNGNSLNSLNQNLNRRQ